MRVVKGYTKKQLEDYANQRVMEKLEDLYNRAQGSGRNITNAELKQEIEKLKQF